MFDTELSADKSDATYPSWLLSVTHGPGSVTATSRLLSPHATHSDECFSSLCWRCLMYTNQTKPTMFTVHTGQRTLCFTRVASYVCRCWYCVCRALSDLNQHNVGVVPWAAGKSVVGGVQWTRCRCESRSRVHLPRHSRPAVCQRPTVPVSRHRSTSHNRKYRTRIRIRVSDHRTGIALTRSEIGVLSSVLASFSVPSVCINCDNLSVIRGYRRSTDHRHISCAL